jgi:hypothetical protein
MRIRLLIALLLALAATPAGAQPRADAAEIAFWESVRDSRNPAELQAYLQQYPNGVFRPLAEARLATLQQPVAAPPPGRAAPVAPGAAPVAWTTPKAGDQWTYRWRETKRANAPERALVVTVVSASDVEVMDQASVDGGTPFQSRQPKGSHLVTEGPAIFSPYLLGFSSLPARSSVGRVRIEEPGCAGRYVCEAKGRVMGVETVKTSAGTFNATKVLVEQSWRPAFMGASAGTGGRRLFIWYAPEVKRVVKYTSSTIVGTSPPMEPDFELELVSYKVN